ncbi:hypothetical protein [Candidatus Magnetaquicoccus inordinatus]|uniref:hypothetical protein n=1 Tax=Candidatus Magnetaquicoccus inordinatus TaxID=2496818 RepID=UPI00102C05E7|nr:hypothetical protein [Candidatus Magnetaquicoccus inordinatus]
MNKISVLSAMLSVVVLSGCASKELHPVRINELNTDSASYAVNRDNDIFKKLIVDYNNSNDKPGDSRLAKEFLKSGIATVNIVCKRWFDKMGEKERKIDYNQSVFNSVSDFGIGLLNLSNPSADLMLGLSTGKGTINTILDKYEDSFLLAPSSVVVQERISEMMAKAATEIDKDSDSFDYLGAYQTLVNYESLCSYGKAKSILDKTLSSANITVSKKAHTLGGMVFAIDITEQKNEQQGAKEQKKPDNAAPEAKK